MKILFIYTLEEVESLLKPLRSWSNIQLGISYISSQLKNDGHQTKLLVLGSNNHWRDNIKLLNAFTEEFDPQLVCFTSVASQYPFIKKIASAIKRKWPDKYLIIGGAHASLNPSEVINDEFDLVCIGEGEYPARELCRQLASNTIPHGIANLWIKSQDGRIEKNPTRPFLQDIDKLPFPDRLMWTPWIKEGPGSELSILVGRGCPFKCTYCCNHALKIVAPGNYVRFRSPENIIEEVAYLHTMYPTHSRIYFEVETIAIKKTWLMEFCKQLEALNTTIDNYISYGSNFRISPQSKDERIFSALKKANFSRINIGLESGNPQIRREILKRNYSNTDFLEVTSMARKAGLKFSVYNMVGLPGETYENHLETVLLNRQCQPDMHYTVIFFPYPGTELYDMCVREGFIKSPLNHRLERRQSMIDYPHFSKHQIQKAYTWFNYHVYKGYKPLWWILKQTILVKIRSLIILNYLLRKIAQLPGYSYLQKKLG